MASATSCRVFLPQIARAPQFPVRGPTLRIARGRDHHQSSGSATAETRLRVGGSPLAQVHAPCRRSGSQRPGSPVSGVVAPRRALAQKNRYRAVINDPAPNALWHSLLQKTLHCLTDADDRPRGAINIDGNCAPPLRGHAGEKARVEHIEAVQRQNKRNLQTPRQQGCRVAAGRAAWAWMTSIGLSRWSRGTSANKRA